MDEWEVHLYGLLFNCQNLSKFASYMYNPNATCKVFKIWRISYTLEILVSFWSFHYLHYQLPNHKNDNKNNNNIKCFFNSTYLVLYFIGYFQPISLDSLIIGLFQAQSMSNHVVTRDSWCLRKLVH